jgi:hypothetical protein
MLPALLLSLAILQQHPVSKPEPARLAAYDTTKVLIARLGHAVADVKSGLELFRRAVFNQPEGDVLFAAGYLERACRTLDLGAGETERGVCRRCAAQRLQEALDRYRAAMPSLRRTGARCAARIALLSKGSTPSAASRLRRNVRPIGDAIVRGIIPYEQRLQAVRVEAGWARAPVEPADRQPARSRRR